MPAVDHAPPLTRWSHVWRTALVLAIGVVAWLTIDERETGAVLAVDVVTGLVALALSTQRRRHPFPVMVLTTLLSSFSAFAAGPSTLAAVSLATRRRWAQVVAAGLLNVGCAEAFSRLRPDGDGDPVWVSLVYSVVVTSAILAWGMYIGSRRELLWTLRDRAARAEAEAELRTEQSRLAERSRIAREMHDVLAHRITQISMRAGALSYRHDLTAEEMRESAGVIQEAAHAALTDLRGVLGVLRDDAGGLAAPPQPTYADLGDLVAAARESGSRIVYVDAVVPVADVPDATGRTLYRIVQEGITNARKHAPGAQLTIDVEGSPEAGIGVTLRNPIGFAASAVPGSGLGLVGLSERAGLRGGRLEHRADRDEFVLRGWLPWTA